MGTHPSRRGSGALILGLTLFPFLCEADPCQARLMSVDPGGGAAAAADEAAARADIGVTQEHADGKDGDAQWKRMDAGEILDRAAQHHRTETGLYAAGIAKAIEKMDFAAATTLGQCVSKRGGQAAADSVAAGRNRDAGVKTTLQDQVKGYDAKVIRVEALRNQGPPSEGSGIRGPAALPPADPDPQAVTRLPTAVGPPDVAGEQSLVNADELRKALDRSPSPSAAKVPPSREASTETARITETESPKTAPGGVSVWADRSPFAGVSVSAAVAVPPGPERSSNAFPDAEWRPESPHADVGFKEARPDEGDPNLSLVKQPQTAGGPASRAPAPLHQSPVTAPATATDKKFWAGVVSTEVTEKTRHPRGREAKRARRRPSARDRLAEAVRNLHDAHSQR